ACLSVVAPAQLVGGVHDLGRQALFARLDERGPRMAGVVALVVSLLVAGCAMMLPVGGARLLVLAMAILAGELAAAVTVLSRLHRALRPDRMIDLGALAVPVVAAAAMLPVALAGRWAEHAVTLGRAGELTLAGTGMLLAAGVYVLALRGGLARRAGEPT
ncbi:MAG TPA: hypothetical protein VHH34_14915, partial [Pseudonocardiaceae bacterium]|nr:hypothetical protein [Pseudonocardiaceae bacterium]